MSNELCTTNYANLYNALHFKAFMTIKYHSLLLELFRYHLQIIYTVFQHFNEFDYCDSMPRGNIALAVLINMTRHGIILTGKRQGHNSLQHVP